MQTKIELRITFETPFNIGSDTKAGTFADRPLRKDKNGWPYIPATSLRGRLRHRIEQIARTMKLKPSPCFPPVADSMCQANAVNQICPVCQIFGSPWYPSPLRFSDLKLVSPALLANEREGIKPAPPTDLRYGVTLSRQRRVAEDALLYTTEVFSPGIPLTFAGEVNGDLTLAQLALFVAGVKSLSNLGRGKTSGLGWCKMEAIILVSTTIGSCQPISVEVLAKEIKQWSTKD